METRIENMITEFNGVPTSGEQLGLITQTEMKMLAEAMAAENMSAGKAQEFLEQRFAA